MSLFFKRSSERLYKKSPMKESWYAFVPNQTHFGALCGFADDIVAGGQGFGMHPHENMEISTIVLSGSQAHRDNTGSEGIINEYSIQTMSAGKGIMHSEYNASPTLSFHSFQIWVYPKNKDVMPRHEKFNFQPDEKLNKIMLALSPDRRDKTALINQDAFLSVCRLEAKNAVHYVLHQEGNGVYIHCASGTVEKVEQKLHAGDAIGITETNVIQITAAEDAELIFAEVPMQFGIKM